MLARGFAAILTLGLGAASAAAADLDQPPLTTIQAASFKPRWEGFSIGGNITGLTSPSESGSQVWFAPYAGFSSQAPTSFGMSGHGIGGGLQAGYDKQFGPLVIGGVVDYDFIGGAKTTSSASGTVNWPSVGWNAVPYGSTYAQELASLGSVRAKLGYAVDDDWLVYATGGVAFGRTTSSASMSLSNGWGFAGGRSGMSDGYIYGAGVQYAIGPNWSIGAEALKYDLGSKDTAAIADFVVNQGLNSSPSYDTRANFSGYQLRLSAVYEFDGGAGDARIVPSADPGADIPVVVGMRAAYSVGQSRMTLYDATGSARLSRLTYRNSTSFAAEPYFRLEMPTWNMFVSGYLGFGAQTVGTLRDEDWPNADTGVTSYSSTHSSLSDGQLSYAVADLGYYALQSSWYQLGGSVGYTFLKDDYNAFGCNQTATNTQICYGGPSVSGVQPNNLTISDSYTWNALRLGLAATLKLPGGVSWSGSAAWLPVIEYPGSNDHWLRMPGGSSGGFSGPLPSAASGSTGFQLEGEWSYMISPNFNVGVGARYWSLAAAGHVNFQDAAVGGQPQVAKFSTQRAQAFVESGFHF